MISIVTLLLTDKREFKGKIIGSDKASDVALVKIDGANLPRVTLGDSRTRSGPVNGQLRYRFTIRPRQYSDRESLFPPRRAISADLLQADPDRRRGQSRQFRAAR